MYLHITCALSMSKASRGCCSFISSKALVCVYIYIYIHIYISLSLYIYIYIYIYVRRVERVTIRSGGVDRVRLGADLAGDLQTHIVIIIIIIIMIIIIIILRV